MEWKLRLMPCCVPVYILLGTAHSSLFLICFMIAESLALRHMNDRKKLCEEHSFKRKFAFPCGEQELLHKLLCNTAASQSAALVWGERSNTIASSACRTANWPHVTAAPFSSVCCLALPGSPRFPAFSVPIFRQFSDERGLCAVCWWRQQEVMRLVNPPSGCMWFYPSLLPLSDRFLSTCSPVSRHLSLPACVSLLPERRLFKFPWRIKYILEWEEIFFFCWYLKKLYFCDIYTCVYIPDGDNRIDPTVQKDLYRVQIGLYVCRIFRQT